MRFSFLLLFITTCFAAASPFQPELLTQWMESLSKLENEAHYSDKIKGLALKAHLPENEVSQAFIFYEQETGSTQTFAREYLHRDGQWTRRATEPKVAALTPPSLKPDSGHSHGRKIESLTLNLTLAALLDASTKVRLIPGRGRLFAENLLEARAWLEHEAIAVVIHSQPSGMDEFSFFFECHFHGEGEREKMSCHRRVSKNGSEPVLSSPSQPEVQP